MHKNFILPEGLSGRLSFNITNNGEPATAELAGAVFGEGGAKIPFQAVQADRPVLITPRMPAGLHRYEIRAGACPVLYGHLEVCRSPLADTPGEQQWTIDVDLAAEVAVLHIELNEGATGPQGPKGDKGDPGPAPTAEQMQAAAAEMLYVPATTPYRTIEGTGDADLHWLQLDARRVPAGRLQAISIPCRDNVSANIPGITALYLTLWEKNEDGSDYTMLGSSTEAVLQVVGQTARWEFEGIELSGRTFRLCAALEPGVWAQNQWLGVRMADRETGEDTRGVGWGNIYQVTDITFEMEGVAPRFAAREDLEEIHGKFAVVDSRFEDVNTKFTDVNTKFTDVNGKFCDVEDKLYAADVKFDEVNTKFDEVNTKFTNVDDSVSELFYKWYDTINPHIDSRTVHITAEERARWDGNTMSPAEKAYMAQLLNNTEPPTSTGKLITEDVLLRHAECTDMHVTAEERTRWDAAAPATHVGDATHLQNGGQKLVVKGMDGAVKLTIQGLVTNTQVTGNALYVNVPDFSQKITSTCLYSSTESAAYIPWFAAALEATALTAFGIAEPGVHVGHGNYPLRLKGSVVSINGVTVDAAALAQLVAHKDELLALLESSAANETST